MNKIALPREIIINIFSYGDVDDIPKRKMVFDQLLFLKKEYIYHKYECSCRYHRSHYINTSLYHYILEKNRIKMNMNMRSDKLNFKICRIFIPCFPNFTEHHFPF